MFGKHMVFLDKDLEAIKKLDSFLPNKIFDAHAHIFSSDFTPSIDTQSPGLILGAKEFENEMRTIFGPFRKLYANMIIFPDKSMGDTATDNLSKSDAFLKDQLDKLPGSVGEIIVTPSSTADELEKRITHPGIRGFKCYHVLADKKTTWDCDIGEYLPESAWQVADKHKMVITLHMVKDLALADEGNMRYIKKMSQRYPNAVLILAHAARSFAAWTGIESVEKLKDCENIWFDFSAVCESPAMLQIMKKVGVDRCMWGSDYPVCRARGKAISLGDSFYWIYQNDLDNFSSKTTLSSWLIAIENLMATRQACILADLNEDRVEDLFYNNAAKLFTR